MKLLTSILMLLASTEVLAFDHGDLDHLAMHTGASYIIQNTTYGLLHKTAKAPAVRSELFAAAVTLMIGLAYKQYENAPGRDTARAMSENALGVGLAAATHFTFNW